MYEGAIIFLSQVAEKRRKVPFCVEKKALKNFGKLNGAVSRFKSQYFVSVPKISQGVPFSVSQNLFLSSKALYENISGRVCRPGKEKWIDTKLEKVLRKNY